MALVPAYGASPLRYSSRNGATVQNVVPYQPAYTATGTFPKATGDPFWSSVNGLWLWNNGSFADSSPNNTILTNTGGVTIVTGAAPGGYGAIQLSGSNYLVNTAKTVFEYSGAYTMETYVNFTANGSSVTGSFPLGCGVGTGGVWDGMATSVSRTTVNFASDYSGSGFVGTITPGLNTWTHIALMRGTDNTVRLAVGGVLSNSGSDAVAITTPGISIGARTDGNAYTFVTGQMGPVRMTAANRYPKFPFTPPLVFPTHG